LAVRGGEPPLLPAPLPVGEGVVPEPPRCLHHPEKPALLLVVRVQTESECSLLHALEDNTRLFDLSPNAIHPTAEAHGLSRSHLVNVKRGEATRRPIELNYSTVAETYRKLDAVSGRIEMTEILAELLK